MPTTSASSPATLRNPIRRVRLGELLSTKKCQARWTKEPARATDGTPSAGPSASVIVDDCSAVRSSTWSPQPVIRVPYGNVVTVHPHQPLRVGRSRLLETIADAVERRNHVEGIVDALELLSQALNVTVNGAVVDIDLVVVGRIHESVAALDHPWSGCQRLQDQEFSDRERHRLGLPRADMSFRIHPQLATFQHLGVGFLGIDAVL